MTPEGVNIKHPDKLYIGGQWVAPKSGSSIEVVNPNSEEVIARVAAAGPADMDVAIAAAREAFDNGPWPTTPPAERAAKLVAMADHLEARIGELSAAWTAQVGGLASFAPIMHGGGIAGIRSIAAMGESFAWTEKRPGQQVDTAVIVREPVGVVVGIAPWNAPISFSLPFSSIRVNWYKYAGDVPVLTALIWARVPAMNIESMRSFTLRFRSSGVSSG